MTTQADSGAVRFTGKTAIITGGSRGIGRATAARLGREGAHVLITGRTRADLDTASAALTDAGVENIAMVADVTDPEAPERMVSAVLEQWGRLDVLINNAGIAEAASFLEIERERWDMLLDVLLTGPCMIAQRCGREMARGGGGSIVNIASFLGHVTDGPYATYGVAKAGLIALTRNIATELADQGVRCNSISPGFVHTSMTDAHASQELIDALNSGFERVPIGRMLTAEEIAATCAFLASDEASGITGADLLVDGGLMADAYAKPVMAEIERRTMRAAKGGSARGLGALTGEKQGR
jgi:NAD(P)-dependent dehydrogenase (short-subunit alcohol dehydrogenase family)